MRQVTNGTLFQRLKNVLWASLAHLCHSSKSAYPKKTHFRICVFKPASLKQPHLLACSIHGLAVALASRPLRSQHAQLVSLSSPLGVHKRQLLIGSSDTVDALHPSCRDQSEWPLSDRHPKVLASISAHAPIHLERANWTAALVSGVERNELVPLQDDAMQRKGKRDYCLATTREWVGSVTGFSTGKFSIICHIKVCDAIFVIFHDSVKNQLVSEGRLRNSVSMIPSSFIWLIKSTISSAKVLKLQ